MGPLIPDVFTGASLYRVRRILLSPLSRKKVIRAARGRRLGGATVRVMPMRDEVEVGSASVSSLLGTRGSRAFGGIARGSAGSGSVPWCRFLAPVEACGPPACFVGHLLEAPKRSLSLPARESRHACAICRGPASVPKSVDRRRCTAAWWTSQPLSLGIPIDKDAAGRSNGQRGELTRGIAGSARATMSSGWRVLGGSVYVSRGGSVCMSSRNVSTTGTFPGQGLAHRSAEGNLHGQNTVHNSHLLGTPTNKLYPGTFV